MQFMTAVQTQVASTSGKPSAWRMYLQVALISRLLLKMYLTMLDMPG